MAGAALAKADPMKTGLQASKLAIAAFLVPFMFVYSPAMLMIDATLYKIIQIVITAIIGMIAVGAAVEGWYWTRMAWWERMIAFMTGLLLIHPGPSPTSWLALMGILTVIQYRKAKANRSLLEEPVTAAT